MKSLPYELAIPSFRRPETLCKKTLNYLCQTDVNPNRVTLFLSDPSERAQYESALATHHPGLSLKIEASVLGIGAARNLICAHYPPGSCVFSLDDDIEGLYTRIDRRNVVLCRDLDSLISESFRLCNWSGIRLWGISPTDNPWFMEPVITTDLRYIVACAYGFIANDEERLKVTLEDKEDFERSIRYYLADGRVMRINWVGPKTKYYTEPGGMQATRTKLRVKVSAFKLTKMFPELCELNTSKRSGWAEVKLKDRRDDRKSKSEGARDDLARLAGG